MSKKESKKIVENSQAHNKVGRKKISDKLFLILLLSSNIVWVNGLYILFFGEDWAGIFMFPVPLLMIAVNWALFYFKKTDDVKKFVFVTMCLTLFPIILWVTESLGGTESLSL
ncbi:MAG: hypothetical protein WCW66_06190 [Patescibacteria group bacterium]|jgi:hypothetical protein